MTSRLFLKLIGAVALCELAGVIGSFFTAESINGWYAELVKPAFNPPNWLFAPVWITLYFLIGLAFYFIWLTPEMTDGREKAILAFVIQLFLNTIWSIIFFGMHSTILAFVDISLLLIAIIFAIIYFWRISKPASILLWPYFLWVLFAAYLNLAFLLLN